ncbi:related to PCP1-mitochondrial serine protease [Sporisorium reilianum f. sp. reilianum]|uniref:Related to PCP1-mitochondrial serine protease n=1 Tax=Sporisorium reilianum f. sp. reilianum TaxID=72559 RepID=A0A2N8UKM8_9BASI|nr:related to PCP1-mitochondrial serine protease [Sporisorium reilianum f. sp. reilianum]
MLSPGLTASLRRLSAQTLLHSANAAHRHALPLTPRILASSRIHLYRPLATSSSILSRLRPLSPRRTAPAPPARRTLDRQPSTEDEADLPPPPSDTQQPSISRALLFFAGFSAISFTGAAYYSLKDTQHVASQLQTSRDVFANISSFFSSSVSSGRAEAEIWGPGVSEHRLRIAKNHEVATRLGLRLEWLMGWCRQLHLPEGVTEFVGRSYLIVAEKYLDLPPAKQVVVPVIAVNTAVFALWTIASRRGGAGGMWRWMTRNFVHRPSSARTHTLLTSVYSHQTFVHYLFNNMALWSIGGSALFVAAHHTAGATIPEASTLAHFLAFFTAAGLFAATASHILTALRFRRTATLRGLAAAKATIGRHASLGASGAVYATLVLSAFAFPDAQLGILFVPFVSFPIGVGVAGLVAVDVAGLVRGWKTFDHAAHLAGAAFGVGYWGGGGEAWQWVLRRLVQSGVVAEGR